MSRKMPPEPLMYSTGGAPGSRLVMTSISGLPISPASMRRRTSLKVGSKRRWKPIMQATPAARTFSPHSTARGTDRSTGFSQKMCLPAAAARVIRSEWVLVGEPMTTASIEGLSSASSIVATCAPSCCASCAALSPNGSQTYLRLTPGRRARLPAWMRPMRPAPKTATFFMDGSPGAEQGGTGWGRTGRRG